MTILIPQNDPVDVALDRAGAVWQGQAVEHGGVVLLEPGGEGVQVGLVIGLGGGDPGIEAVAVAAGEDLGELGDVICQRVQVGAAGPHVFELDLLVLVEGGGVAQDPARHVPGLRRRGRGRRGRAQRPEGLQVVPHDAVAAGVAGLFDLGVQLQHVGAPGVPPLVQVGLELIQDRWPPAAGLGQQVLGASRAGEPAHRFFGQPEFPHDRFDALALGQQCLHRLVPFTGALDQRGVLEPLACRGGRGQLQIRFRRRLSRWLRPCEVPQVCPSCELHRCARTSDG